MQKNSIEKLETLTGLSAKIALLVYERQKERGATAGSDARQKEYYDYLASASVENFSPQIKEDIKHLDTFLMQIF